jgi:hypothetical protein
LSASLPALSPPTPANTLPAKQTHRVAKRHC